ncbi:MAG TPA: hypothetical protein VMM77_05725 [Gemmatimonadaceae bacterium]|nr:hypothetical protein [Gemmatimonadaceae bacterium]
MVRRLGRTSLGCLFLLLLLVSGAYFGYEFLDAYYRYYTLRDAMTQEARFAADRSDAMVRLRMRAKADSLGVPDEAVFRVRRNRSGVAIWTTYTEVVRLPIGEKRLRFEPIVQREF